MFETTTARKLSGTGASGLNPSGNSLSNGLKKMTSRTRDLGNELTMSSARSP
ncbi:hypothetical protein ACMAY7_15820 [Rhodobacteraceae bacterium nBUS_24]